MMVYYTSLWFSSPNTKFLFHFKCFNYFSYGLVALSCDLEILTVIRILDGMLVVVLVVQLITLLPYVGFLGS